MIRSFVLIVLSVSALLAGERYALLVGIGQYIPGQGMRNLEGPTHDVEALSLTLTQNYGIPNANIVTLVDAQASRQRILDALDTLTTRVKPGDYVIVYFSSHGTSPQDPAWKQRLPVDADTGAIVPADYKRAATLDEASSRLLVGRRDLRPRLSKLDQKATVLVLADTCFSQNLAKSVVRSRRGTPRSVSVRDLVTTKAGGGLEDDIASDLKEVSEQPKPTPFPYTSVAFMSAALAGQPALDVDSASLKENPKATFDGKPHGQFTSALITGLRGGADRNHDGSISHAELFEYLSDTATKNEWSHQPALSANESGSLMKSLALGVPPRGMLMTRDGAGNLRVSADQIPERLQTEIGAISGLEINSVNANLAVVAADGGYRIHQASGLPVNQTPFSESEMMARLRVEPQIRSLLNWSVPNQSVNVGLSLWKSESRLQQGVFLAGNTFEVHLQTEQSVWPLVVNVDYTGHVSVVYPRADVKPHEMSGDSDLGKNGVSCPCGTEYLKAVVFRQKPEGYEKWGGRDFEPTAAEFRQLFDLVRKGDGETTLRLVTNPQ